MTIKTNDFQVLLEHVRFILIFLIFLFIYIYMYFIHPMTLRSEKKVSCYYIISKKKPEYKVVRLFSWD